MAITIGKLQVKMANTTTCKSTSGTRARPMYLKWRSQGRWRKLFRLRNQSKDTIFAFAFERKRCLTKAIIHTKIDEYTCNIKIFIEAICNSIYGTKLLRWILLICNDIHKDVFEITLLNNRFWILYFCHIWRSMLDPCSDVRIRRVSLLFHLTKFYVWWVQLCSEIS